MERGSVGSFIHALTRTKGKDQPRKKTPRGQLAEPAKTDKQIESARKKKSKTRKYNV